MNKLISNKLVKITFGSLVENVKINLYSKEMWVVNKK